jgi:peptide/nickel transport system substrate-binding protein
VTEVSRGERVTLTRNPGYFGTKPLADKLVFRAIVEDGARTAALESGQVDIATGLPAQDAQRLKGAGITIAAAPSLQAQYLGINVQRPSLGDLKVRQALNYAVDKEALVKTIFLDAFTVADSVLTPGSFGYQGQTRYQYSADKAKELLASAGFGPNNPLKLILWTPEGLYPKDIVVAQAIQAQLKEVGVDVTIQKQESASYFTIMKKPTDQANYDLFMWAFVPSTGDGYQTFQNNLLSDAGDVPSYFNFSRYKNPQLDGLIKQAGSVTDQTKRADLLAQAQKIAWDDAPYVYLYTIGIVNGYGKGVTGVEALPTRYMDLTRATKS